MIYSHHLFWLLFTFVCVGLALGITKVQTLAPSKLVSSNVQTQWLRFIQQSIKAFISKQLKMVFQFVLLLLSVIVLINVILPGHLVIPVFVGLGALIAAALGAVSLTHNDRIVDDLVNTATESDSLLDSKLLHRSRHLTGVHVGLIVADLAVWVWVLDWCFERNIFGLGQWVANTLNTSWNSELSHQVQYINLSNIQILSVLLAYVIGMLLSAVLIRGGSSIFAASADSSADLVASTDYDLPEDDVRNPIMVADMMGDQLNGHYANGIQIQSIIALTVVISGLFGALLGYQTNTYDSFGLVIYPLAVISGALLVSVMVSSLFKSFDRQNQSIMTSVFVILALLSIGAWCQISSWTDSLSVGVGVLMTGILHQIYERLTSKNSCTINTLLSGASTGMISVVLRGFSASFIWSGVVVFGMVVALMSVFWVSGGTTNMVLTFYHFGLMIVGVLSGLFPILCQSFAASLCDNAKGCAVMLSNDAASKRLRDVELTMKNSSAFVSMMTQVASVVSVIGIAFIYLKTIKIDLIELASKGVVHFGQFSVTTDASLTNAVTFFISSMQLDGLVQLFQLHVFNPEFFAGCFVGGIVLWITASYLFSSVASNGAQLIDLARDQMSHVQGIFDGKQLPDYSQIIQSAQSNAIQRVFKLGLILVGVPLVVSALLGISGALGTMTGMMVITLFVGGWLSSLGAFWSLMKRRLESEPFDSVTHINSVVGDVIGDSCESTVSPLMHLLTIGISVMFMIFGMVAIVSNEWLVF